MCASKQQRRCSADVKSRRLDVTQCLLRRSRSDMKRQLIRVWRAKSGVSGPVVALWWLGNPNPKLAGRTPWEAVLDGDFDQVMWLIDTYERKYDHD